MRCYYAPKSVSGEAIQQPVPYTSCNIEASAVIVDYYTEDRDEQGKIFLCTYHYNIWKQGNRALDDRRREYRH